MEISIVKDEHFTDAYKVDYAQSRAVITVIGNVNQVNDVCDRINRIEEIGRAHV